MDEFYDNLDKLYESGDIEAVEAFLSGAIAETGEYTPERAGLLSSLASIHLHLGQLGVADRLVSEALEIYNTMAELSVHQTAALTIEAVLMCRKGNYQGSLNSFRQALALTKRFFGENIDFAICRRNISEVCELLGDIPSAIEEMSGAVRIMEKLLDPGHASVKTARAELEQLMERLCYERTTSIAYK